MKPIESCLYREKLRSELVRRIRSNPYYSQRAFARDLGLSPSRLNEVLSGKHGLSLAGAAQVADRLGLKDAERSAFLDSVESLHGRSALSRKKADARLRAWQAGQSAGKLEADAFEVISDWYHFAYLELIGLPAFEPEPAWAARALGITVPEVEQITLRLERVGLLAREADRWVAREEMTIGPDGVPSEAVRKFHTQILDKASRALESQALSQRDFSASVLSIDHSRIDEAKADIRKFRHAFIQKYGSDQQKTGVYCVAIQLFDLLQNQKQELLP